MATYPARTERQPAGGPGGGTVPRLPAEWPSAWPSLSPRLLRRAGFVAAVQALTAVGLLLVADLATQWWALLPPLLLLTGPALAPARARRRAQRAAAAGRLTVDADGTVRLDSPRRRPIATVSGGTVRYLR